MAPILLRDRQSGLNRLHQTRQRYIAVMFLVNISGTTKSCINQAEHEPLILLCELLEKLGDRQDDTIPRVCGIEARDYTRMGVTDRHLSMRLNEIIARIKLLITL